MLGDPTTWAERSLLGASLLYNGEYTVDIVQKNILYYGIVQLMGVLNRSIESSFKWTRVYAALDLLTLLHVRTKYVWSPQTLCIETLSKNNYKLTNGNAHSNLSFGFSD